jgi:hypothetical protein
MRARSLAGGCGLAVVLAVCLFMLSVPGIAGAAVSRQAATAKALHALGVADDARPVRVFGTRAKVPGGTAVTSSTAATGAAADVLVDRDTGVRSGAASTVLRTPSRSVAAAARRRRPGGRGAMMGPHCAARSVRPVTSAARQPSVTAAPAAIDVLLRPARFAS